MQILHANVNDAGLPEVLAALHAACFIKAWDAEAMRGLLQTQGTEVWLAQQEGAVCGFLMARLLGDAGDILTICIVPKMRRQGGAQALLAALDLAGAPNLTLEVDEQNRAAVQLYQENGYRILHRRSGYYGHADGQRSDALLMRKIVP